MESCCIFYGTTDIRGSFHIPNCYYKAIESGDLITFHMLSNYWWRKRIGWWRRAQHVCVCPRKSSWGEGECFEWFRFSSAVLSCFFLSFLTTFSFNKLFKSCRALLPQRRTDRQTNRSSVVTNCRRLWHPEWIQYGATCHQYHKVFLISASFR